VLKKILEWPNSSLKKVSEPIFKIDDEVCELVKNLIDTCNIMFGAGLAAPQIGVSRRIVVIKPSEFGAENIDPSDYNKDFMVLINPSLEASGDDVEWVESCLSLPGTEGKVTRKTNAEVSYMTLEGETKKIIAQWPFSGGLQHEIDHLEGVLYIQRQPKKKSWSTLYKLKRYRRKQMIQDRRTKRMRK